MFQEPIQGTAVQWVVSLPSLLCMWQFPSLSLPFMTLTVSRYLCRSLSRYLSYKDVPRFGFVWCFCHDESGAMDFFSFFSFSFFGCTWWLGGILVPRPGRPAPPAEETWHLDHWAPREAPWSYGFWERIPQTWSPPNHMSGCINKWYLYGLTSAVSSHHLVKAVSLGFS